MQRMARMPDRLMKNDEISARLEWIKANAAENAGVTVALVLN